jgi:hypothetical protein
VGVKPITLLGIPHLSHNPKISRFDDAESVPVLWNFFAQEAKCFRSELCTGGVAFIVRDMLVHDAPEPLNRIEMRA